MEAQSEYTHVAYHFRTLGTHLYAQLVLVNKISASELSRKPIVGWVCCKNFAIELIFLLKKK